MKVKCCRLKIQSCKLKIVILESLLLHSAFIVHYNFFPFLDCLFFRLHVFILSTNQAERTRGGLATSGRRDGRREEKFVSLCIRAGVARDGYRLIRARQSARPKTFCQQRTLIVPLTGLSRAESRTKGTSLPRPGYMESRFLSALKVARRIRASHRG